ncbi:MAG: peptidoglycan binding domain-containing protein, partial [Coriobacteriia bacterium]|nr:peptidoglycan binding domain-containing protein [Coriobacteriia bacterium]
MKQLRLLVIAAAVIAVFASASPVFAADASRGSISASVTVGGDSLFGLSEVDARALIVANTSVPSLAPLDIACEGTTRTVAASAGVVVDVDAMLDEAYASTSSTPFELPVRYGVDAAVVRGWIAPFASSIDRPAVNSRYVVSGRSLVVTAASAGRRVEAASGSAAISASLLASLDAGGEAQPPVILTVVVVAPTITPANIGRAILIVLGKYRLYSYNVGLERVYRCAIGLRRYPTPRGS